MRLRRAFIIGVLIASAALSCAQAIEPPSSQRPATWRIAGKVLHATTGQPLPGIEVSIASTAEREKSFQTVTGPDGHFAFGNLVRGKYSLYAQARGFSAQAYQQHGPYSTAIAVGPQLKSDNLTFRLVPDGSISGSVVDEENEPVRNGQVSLILLGEENHRPRWQGQSVVDEQGHFHFAHLQPGAYLLAVSAQPWYAQDPQVPPKLRSTSPEDPPPSDINSNAPSENASSPLLDVAYPLTYYPSVTEAGNAAPIKVSPGERVLADVTLRAVPALHLTIRNSSSDSSRPTSVMLMQRIFENFEGAPFPVQARSQPLGAGVISVTGFPPGRFQLSLRTFNGKEWRRDDREVDLQADTEIEASEPGMGSVTVEGVVQVSDGTALPPGGYIRFINRKSGEHFGSPISPQGTFEAQQTLAEPRTFEVSVFNVGDFRVREITAGGATVSGHGLQIPRNGTVPLKVVLAKGLARIDGTVLLDDKPLSGVMVVLVPENPEGNIDLFRRDQSDSDGTFSLYQVAPGHYTVVAIQNGWDVDWQDPAVLKPYLENGKRIEITAPQTYTLSVKAQATTAAASQPSQP